MPRSSYEKSEETRARIVDVAYHLFIERGYSATSMRDISRGAGVTVGAIYNHFPTKETLWVEVFITYHPYHQVFPAVKAAQGETIAEFVRSAAKGMIQELFKRPDLLNLMFTEVVEFKASHMLEMYQKLFPEIMGLSNILDGKHGHLRELQKSILVRSFAGLFISYYLVVLLGKNVAGITDDEASLSEMVDLYLFGVLGDDDPARLSAGDKRSSS